MTNINDLNTIDALTDNDKLVIWNGSTRAITAQDAANYFSGSGNVNLGQLLTSIQSLSPTIADQLIYTTGSDFVSVTPITPFSRSLLSSVSAATALTTLGGQPLDATLTAVAGLTVGVGDYIEATGVDTFRARKLTIATNAVLTAIPASNRHDTMLAYVAGQAAIDDGGGGWWRFSAASAATADTGTVLQPGTGTGRWLRINISKLYIECFGGGTGVAATDQAAFAAAAASGKHITLRAGRTYYMTAGLTPITGFGITFEDGAKIVAVTQASGSGSAGFKNYSGSGANRNAPAGTMFMLTASGGEFAFVNPVFEGDNANQPILRPIFAQGCTLNIYGKITVTKMNAPNGCLSLNEMLGGTIEGYDFRANADMVDASYTDLTNYSPAGIVIDDDGTFRSSRMTFGPGIVKAFNRASGGSDPYESDGITVGGIGKALRSGAVGGHVFGPIYVEDLGEGVDCFQDDCVFESITARSCALFGVKFVHGAQSNVVQWLDVDTYGAAAITFAGSSATATATRDNVVIDGIVRNGGKIGTGEVSVVLFQENGGTGVARANRVEFREAVVDADTDYLAKDNHSGSALDNRVRIRVVTGALGASAAATTVASNLQLRVGGSLTRLTLSGNQTGIVTATYTTVTFDTVQIDLLSEAVTASNKIRIKYPGRYVVRTSVRMGLNDGDEIETRILKNGVGSTGGTKASGSSTIAENYTAERFIHVTENEAGTADADYRVEVRVVSSGSITITNAQLLTFFEIASFE